MYEIENEIKNKKREIDDLNAEIKQKRDRTDELEKKASRVIMLKFLEIILLLTATCIIWNQYKKNDSSMFLGALVIILGIIFLVVTAYFLFEWLPHPYDNALPIGEGTEFKRCRDDIEKDKKALTQLKKALQELENENKDKQKYVASIAEIHETQEIKKNLLKELSSLISDYMNERSNDYSKDNIDRKLVLSGSRHNITIGGKKVYDFDRSRIKINNKQLTTLLEVLDADVKDYLRKYEWAFTFTSIESMSEVSYYLSRENKEIGRRKLFGE